MRDICPATPGCFLPLAEKKFSHTGFRRLHRSRPKKEGGTWQQLFLKRRELRVDRSITHHPISCRPFSCSVIAWVSPANKFENNAPRSVCELRWDAAKRLVAGPT
ncbi:hypothetical protein MTO96_008650 [Rhipicephalus appendiculatus]